MEQMRNGIAINKHYKLYPLKEGMTIAVATQLVYNGTSFAVL